MVGLQSRHIFDESGIEEVLQIQKGQKEQVFQLFGWPLIQQNTMVRLSFLTVHHFNVSFVMLRFNAS